ncbi:MAG: hypothetical protein JO295_11620 [Verrucomicrobia bacterium]|nr:hypothetical protein [Verrucomicrobiota bacterium]
MTAPLPMLGVSHGRLAVFPARDHRLGTLRAELRAQPALVRTLRAMPNLYHLPASK